MTAIRTRDLRLQQIRIASPCGESWDSMRGDDRIRHCDRCKLNVYNFASMTAEEVQGLLDETEGRLCGRIFRRSDGTMLLRDCPVGLATVRRRVARAGLMAAALLISTAAGIAAALGGGRSHHVSQSNLALSLREFRPFAAIARWSTLSKDSGTILPPPPGPALMGDVVGMVLPDDEELSDVNAR